MCEAVQNTQASGDMRNGQAVVFLIKKKAGFLPVFDINQIVDTIFRDFRKRRVGDCFPTAEIPAFLLGQTLTFPHQVIVSLLDPSDLLTILLQNVSEHSIDAVLSLPHSEGKTLDDKKIGKTVNSQTGKSV